MVNYVIPSVSSELELERRCPHCNRSGGNIHSVMKYRRISDTKAIYVPQRRMKCPWCETTWTLRAQGVTAGPQRSQRLISIGVLLYMLGLNYRSVQQLLPCLECKGSKSRIERDVAKAGQKARDLHIAAPPMRVRVLGVYGTGAKMAGMKAGLVFFVDIERQKLICVEPIAETDTRKLRRHVRDAMSQVRAEQLRSDELSVYNNMVSEDDHEICTAHWLKSKCKRANALRRELKREGFKFEAENMRQLIKLLHAEPLPHALSNSLDRLVRRFINCRHGLLWKVNQLLQQVDRTWQRVSRDPTDATNNTTERLMGLNYKIRAKTMRGFKAIGKSVNHCYLSEFLRGTENRGSLRQVT
jgi:transposase-like protein